MNTVLTPLVRKWLYGISIAVILLLVGYGIIDSNKSTLWISLLTALLLPSSAVALAHVDTPPVEGENSQTAEN